MKKQFSVLCLMLALGAMLLAASPGYCYREKPDDCYRRQLHCGRQKNSCHL